MAKLHSLDRGQSFLDKAAEQQIQPTDPVDIFNAWPLPAFPSKLLPEPIASFASDQGELIGVDPAIIGLAAIGAAAACIDDRIEIQPKRYDPTWREQPRLWLAIIGNPAVKKSPGLKKALGPAFTIDGQWRKESASALAEWEKTKDQEPRPPKPPNKRLIVNDATVEKLSDMLAESEPRGVLSYQDELSGWFSSMDVYKGGGHKDRAALLEAYNGGPRSVDRVKRGSTFVENWSMCVVGGIQPSVVHEYANATNHDGLIQRFILLYAADAPMGQDRCPDMDSKTAYKELFIHLAELVPSGDAVQLSEDAHQIRENLDGRLHKAVRFIPNQFLTAALGKWSGLFARLVLVFHCIECARDKIFPTDRRVSKETAQQVADLMWDVFLPHAMKFYGGIDNTEDRARDVAALILAQQWDRFTVKRDLNRYMKSSRRWKPWELDEALDRLEAYGWITPDDYARLSERGRPTAYLVVQEVHEKFKAQAEQERERRAEVRELMKALKQ